jgi:mRNA-degrading endonuclease RelE of RelBE toxin-antitoxin system
MKGPVFGDRATATFEGEVILYRSEAAARNELRELWEPASKASGPGKGHYAPPAEPAPQPSEDWLAGFAQSFRTAVNSIDRNLQGVILQAIADIAVAPLNPRGAMLKPLRGEMSGFWRYRNGDFRLVYYPDEASRTITFCGFASLGSVYD